MNGYVSKLLDNIERLVQSGADVQPLIDAAKSQSDNNHDANPEEWEQLNRAVEGLPEQSATASPRLSDQQRSDAITGYGRADNAGPQMEGADGKAGERYVSQDEPGTGTNPIGYPGTDQDQSAPGQRQRTVPGQKLNK